MKNNKAPGEDGILIDVKEGADELNKHIVKLFNMCLKKEKHQKNGIVQKSYCCIKKAT